MSIIVQKYGGSSVADLEKIRRVARKIIARKRQGHDLVVVVSAMGDTTDELLDMARQLAPEPSRRELDMLLSVGERISMALLSAACGLIMAAGALLLGAWGAAVGAHRGASEVRSGAALAGAGGLLALLGGVGIATMSAALGTPLYASGAALVLGAPALVLSSIQHGTSEADQARQSENRLSAVICVLGAVLCTALVSVLEGTMALHEALSYASDEGPMPQMVAAISGRETALLLGSAATAIAALSGALVCALGARHTPVGRILASAALAGMGLALSGGVTAAISQQHSQLVAFCAAYTLEGVSGAVQDLPVEPAPAHSRPAARPMCCSTRTAGCSASPTAGPGRSPCRCLRHPLPCSSSLVASPRGSSARPTGAATSRRWRSCSPQHRPRRPPRVAGWPHRRSGPSRWSGTLRSDQRLQTLRSSSCSRTRAASRCSGRGMTAPRSSVFLTPARP